MNRTVKNYSVNKSGLNTYYNVEKVLNEAGKHHDEKIKQNWLQTVKDEDLVLIPGDFSWEMHLKEMYNDFKYLNDKSLKSTTTLDLAYNIANNPDAEVILIDLNDSNQINLCNDMIFLIEPGLIKLNKLIRSDREIFEKLKDKKIVLNKSILNERDINDFELEANTKVFFNIPYLDDKKEHEQILDDFLVALGFSRLNGSNSGKAKLFNIFK